MRMFWPVENQNDEHDKNLEFNRETGYTQTVTLIGLTLRI